MICQAGISILFVLHHQMPFNRRHEGVVHVNYISRKIGLTVVLIMIAMGPAITTAAMAQTYDTVILDGRVMDPETMFDAVRNVGVKGGRIAKITKEKITGNEIIDATGYVVAPGFIDTHFHSLDMFAVKFALRDGVTTGMDLEYGAWPIDTWYAAKKENWPMNYGTLVSQEVVRMIVHDGLVIKEPMDATNAFSVGRGFAAKDGVKGWSEPHRVCRTLFGLSLLLRQ